jgi:hypothetical protein
LAWYPGGLLYVPVLGGYYKLQQTTPPPKRNSGRFSGLITMILKQSNTQLYLCDYFKNPILIFNYGSQFCFEKSEITAQKTAISLLILS